MTSKFWRIDKWISDDLIKHTKEASFYMKNPNISQCIDGRRTKNESNFWISIPGGGIWQLAVMLSVIEETIIAKDRDFREKIFNILLDVLDWEQNLSFHTDEHCTWKWIWCWHLTLLLKPEARKVYGLSDDSAYFIQEILDQYKDKALVNVLKWWHEEVWIIKVHSTHHSIHANHNWKQFFIYTPEIALIRNKEIARKIYNEFVLWTSISITKDALTEMLQRKTDLNFYHTVHKLAPSLPVYRLKHSLCWNIKLFTKIADKSIDINFHD